MGPCKLGEDMNDKPLRIAILGSGAMGSLFGGCLAEGGAEVTLFDVNEAHLDAIRREGLRLVTDQGDRRFRLPVGYPSKEMPAPDLLMVFTKTMHTRSALSAATHLIGPHTILLSLQNGLGNAEILEEFAPPARIMLGVTTYPADLHGPGHVSSHGDGEVRFMSADGQRHHALERLTAAFTAGGMTARMDPQVRVAIWQKVAFNAALNSICATTGATVGDVGACPEGRALVRTVVDEVVSVALAKGVTADADAVHRATEHAMDTHLTHRPSMLQDVLAGRPTEIASINGAVVQEAEQQGVSVPATLALLHLVRIIERRGR